MEEKKRREGGRRIRRLLPRNRRSLWRLIFSRVGIVALLLLLEFGILFSVFHWLGAYFKWFSVIQTLFSIGMVFHLFNCSMDASAKLTWLNLIMLFPVPSSIMLWYTEKDMGHRLIKSRMEELIDATRGQLPQDEAVLEDKEVRDSGLNALNHYLNRSGCFPIYKDTQVTYFPSGEKKFAALLEELEKAKKFVYLEYFIIGEGVMWGSILEILARKAAEGVDVRVMYDGMCEISTLTADYPKRLEKLGIRCRAFSPLAPFISTHYNYRDHRKILVIDGKVAFNGGVNLADEYINQEKRFGHWKDAAVMLKGSAVQSFTMMFLQMWNMLESEVSWDASTVSVPSEESDGFVMPFGDCPLDDDKVGENVYMDILNRAGKYVHIMTPYLILDNELENALRFAAERGVDVKLIMPGIPDKISAYSLAKTHYRNLVASGVKIYEYTPGFVHSKVFVSDDVKAVVGSINLDYRSLYHHFECATYLYKTRCIADIEADFQETLEACEMVTWEGLSNTKRIYRFLGRLLKFFAPLM